MKRRTFLIGLSSAAAAPALPASAQVHWIDVSPLGIGHSLCSCADYLADGRYRAAFKLNGVPHIAGCTWPRALYPGARIIYLEAPWLKEIV